MIMKNINLCFVAATLPEYNPWGRPGPGVRPNEFITNQPEISKPLYERPAQQAATERGQLTARFNEPQYQRVNKTKLC